MNDIFIHTSTEEVEYERNIMGEIHSKSLEFKKINNRLPLAFSEVYGCKQNESDMEIIRGMLLEMGYDVAPSPDEADLIIINTCAVREGAEHRIYGNVGSFKKLKEKNRELIIVVCGCMMQQPQVVEKIRHSYPYVDIIFGTHNIHRFPSMLERRLKTKKHIVDIEEGSCKIPEGLPVKRENNRSALVTIMYGCNNFCSYCIVPYTRGRERSRESCEILKEIRSLANEGFIEITLLGQNVNSYGKDLDDNVSFSTLLREINNIKEIKRIRFMTSHPKDLSDELIDTMAECENICEHLHLPFQAGSDRILKLMNRKYTKEEYISLTDKIKKRIPKIVLSTDVIVGFPSETTDDFLETLDVINRVKFDGVYSFIYSKRTGTPAAEMEDDKTREDKQVHFDMLLDAQKSIGYEHSLSYLDTIVEVLVEGNSRVKPELLTGRTRTNKIVHFKGDNSLIGKLANVKITAVKTWYITGEVVNTKLD